MRKRPIGIDLFAGAGGMSLGFEQAGFDVVAAVEVDPIHAAVHHYNFPRCSTIARSVVSLSGKEIRKLAGLHDEPIDVVFGGPPCQGFSLIGQRMLEDPRNRLVGEFVRLVAELEPTTFVFENVRGLTVGKHRNFLDELIEAFARAGYSIRLPWQVLNALNFGVPQDRQRLFLLGSRRGCPVPRYPHLRTFPSDGLLSAPNGLATPTCEEAIGDLPDAEDYDQLLESDAVMTHAWARPSAYARSLRCLSEDAWHFGYRRIWQPDLLTSSMRTVHTPISRHRFTTTPGGEIEPISRFFKLARKGFCNTLRAGTDSARGAFTSPRPIHYERPRCITVREMARLHGYPDWFRFHTTKWHGARQVGNSVPPPLARAVAETIIAAIGQAPRRPSEELPLDRPELLSMDMSQAARYWRIPVPIGKRDRKSGQRKRKQCEIHLTLA